ncbi:MAG TPA: transcriptional regulator, partial [Mucilaginibacter sp.]|nr:transcriptional regulator [Mucilaginibacter sp.]
MKKRKSTVFDSGELDGPVVSLPGNRKKGKTLEQYKDDSIGKIGTAERDLYEAELRMDIIQDLIKDARKKRNLSQQELGELVGVKKSQISKLEKGYNNTS